MRCENNVLGVFDLSLIFFFPLKHRAYSCLNAKREREVVCNVLAGCVFIILAVVGLLSEVLNL